MLGSKSQTVHISSLPPAYEQEREERRERQIPPAYEQEREERRKRQIPPAYEQEREERRERQIIKHLRLYSFGVGG